MWSVLLGIHVAVLLVSIIVVFRDRTYYLDDVGAVGLVAVVGVVVLSVRVIVRTSRRVCPRRRDDTGGDA